MTDEQKQQAAERLRANNALGDAFERKVGDKLATSGHNYDWQKHDGGTITDFELFDADGDRMAIVECKGGESWGRTSQLRQMIDRTANRSSYVTPEGEHLLMVVTEDGHMPPEVAQEAAYAAEKGVKIVAESVDNFLESKDLKNLKPVGEFLNEQPPEQAKAWLASQSQEWVDRHGSEINNWIENQGADAADAAKDLKNGSEALSSWVDREAKSPTYANTYPEATKAIQQAAKESPANNAPTPASTKLDAPASGDRPASNPSKGAVAPQPASVTPKAAPADKPAAPAAGNMPKQAAPQPTSVAPKIVPASRPAPSHVIERPAAPAPVARLANAAAGAQLKTVVPKVAPVSQPAASPRVTAPAPSAPAPASVAPPAKTVAAPKPTSVAPNAAPMSKPAPPSRVAAPAPAPTSLAAKPAGAGGAAAAPKTASPAAQGGIANALTKPGGGKL
jgi:hypothetical protein